MKYKNIISNSNQIIKGPLEIMPEKFCDERGYFLETWNQSKFNNCLKKEIAFVQDNESMSRKNVLRGLHFQKNPNAQGKLVSVTKGTIYDLIVDLRKDSPTFCKWAGIELNEDSNNQLWVPIGFAHGFITVSEIAHVRYKTTNYWSSINERCLNWDDRDLNINWQISKYNLDKPIVSIKDSKASSLNELNAKGDLF